jgi:hypothetical protein
VNDHENALVRAGCAKEIELRRAVREDLSGAVMQGQLTEMKTASRIAEESLVATQRPWVSVKLAIGPRGLFFDANGANLDLIFSLKNTGPTPAVTVRIVGSPRIDVGSNDRITELEKVCAEARQKPQNPKMFAQTIFPGETLDLNFTYSFANKELLDLVTEKSHGFILPVVIGGTVHSP